MAPILITGVAGFIGFHVANSLLTDGYQVVGIDNLNDYYDVNLKLARVSILKKHTSFTFIKGDLADRTFLYQVFGDFKPEYVVNLAAQAGVRYSLINPDAYIQSNIVGFSYLLEACRHHQTAHLLYASSSSVYGANRKLPFSVEDNVDHPVSLYAATKKSNELMAYSYSHLYGIPTTGLRFFTVYGPWGRPDMALFLFAAAIIERRPIDIFNYGKMQRDFTYVDDVVSAVRKLLSHIPKPVFGPPYQLFNIGNHQPVPLLRVVELLESELGIPAVRNFLPMQAGDVEATYADIDALERAVGFKPTTSIEDGIRSFIKWYKEYMASGQNQSVCGVIEGPAVSNIPPEDLTTRLQ